MERDKNPVVDRMLQLSTGIVRRETHIVPVTVA